MKIKDIMARMKAEQEIEIKTGVPLSDITFGKIKKASPYDLISDDYIKHPYPSAQKHASDFEALVRIVGPQKAVKLMLKHLYVNPVHNSMLEAPIKEKQPSFEFGNTLSNEIPNKSAQYLDALKLYEGLVARFGKEMVNKFLMDHLMPSNKNEIVNKDPRDQPIYELPKDKPAPSMMFQTREHHEQVAARVEIKEQETKAKTEQFHLVLRLHSAPGK